MTADSEARIPKAPSLLPVLKLLAENLSIRFQINMLMLRLWLAGEC